MARYSWRTVSIRQAVGTKLLSHAPGCGQRRYLCEADVSNRRGGDILGGGDAGPRRRPESISVFNWARGGWQKVVYAINGALGGASGEAQAVMLRAAGG